VAPSKKHFYSVGWLVFVALVRSVRNINFYSVNALIYLIIIIFTDKYFNFLLNNLYLCVAEVRNHGVSYYGFSKDDKLRKVQQEQLSKVRAETKKQQLSAEAARTKRAQQLKARLRAASNRKRQRQGLPPLPDSGRCYAT
jgi:Domain of unknown function (DUF4078)